MGVEARGRATSDSVAIVDIGSNSVRLVVYAGARRAPDPILNEKVLAGLGKGLAPGTSLSRKARARALRALRRFRLLLDAMDVRRVEVVATAAVREAADGADFVREVRQLGLPCRIIPAEEEADLAGLGVLYGIPGADGIVGDLGGGSVELVEVGGGRTGRGLSLPLGVLKLDPGEAGRKAARDLLRSMLAGSGISAAGRPLYLVGGSWRALARLDMAMTDAPLPITHLYPMAPERARVLARTAAAAAPLAGVPSSRQATAPAAAMLLELLVEELGPGALITSAYGIREGLLLARMNRATRALDPLVEAARHRGLDARFGQHGDLLDQWMQPLFAEDPPALARLRLTACLMADVAWHANAAFRAERAIETALHGDWVGLDAAGRVLIAQALSSSFGNSDLPELRLDSLCSADDLLRAHRWGLAIRLGQRLSAGIGDILGHAPILVEDDGLALAFAPGFEGLASDAVGNRLEKLAEAMAIARA